VGDDIHKLSFAHGGDELEVALPALRPAEIVDELKWLTEGEIAGRDPGTIQAEKGFEGRKIEEGQTRLDAKSGTIQVATGDGDWLAAIGRAGEIETEDEHG